MEKCMTLRAFQTTWPFVLLLTLITAGSAFSQQPATGGQQPDAGAVQRPAVDQTYVLGALDVIEVDLLGAAGFKARERIRADGTIQLPFLMSVMAAEKTASELSDEIERLLKSRGFVVDPTVEITVLSPAKSIIVLGAVANPGLIAIDRPYRLSEILARVGGIRETGSDYIILTPERGTQRRISVEMLATGDAAQDPYVAPGDKIFSPKAEVFYISGQVREPGTYPLTSDMTLRMAIARGGGLTETGSESRVRINRRNSAITRADLNAKIEQSDVIVVGEGLF
jgi:polysaccharide export outer membrane protein